MSLLEHRHTLINFENGSGRSIFRFEEWPITRRPKSNAIYAHEKDGTVAIFADGTRVPFISIDKTEKLPEAVADSVLIQLKHIQKEAFTFAFDSLRLNEAALTFLSAIALLSESAQNTPVVEIVDLSFIFRPQDVIFRIELSTGGFLNLKIPDYAVETLKTGFGITNETLAEYWAQGRIGEFRMWPPR